MKKRKKKEEGPRTQLWRTPEVKGGGVEFSSFTELYYLCPLSYVRTEGQSKIINIESVFDSAADSVRTRRVRSRLEEVMTLKQKQAYL